MNKKIKLVYFDKEDNIAVESVWGELEGDYYRIKNIPFFAPNIAYNDLVSVEFDDNELFFDDLITPSGHSTLHIIFFDKNEISKVCQQLLFLGCSWEGSHIKEYISVDIPKEVSYKSIKFYMNDLEQKNILSYKEACLMHKF